MRQSELKVRPNKQFWLAKNVIGGRFLNLYSTVIKKSSPYVLSVVINQLELLNCSHFQFLLAYQVKSPAQKEHFCYFHSFGQVFSKKMVKILITSNSADRIEFNIFCFKNILNEKIFAVFCRKTFISYLDTCKTTKFYLSSMILRKRLIIFEI